VINRSFADLYESSFDIFQNIRRDRQLCFKQPCTRVRIVHLADDQHISRSALPLAPIGAFIFVRRSALQVP
jgi:hypothetical protein